VYDKRGASACERCCVETYLDYTLPPVKIIYSFGRTTKKKKKTRKRREKDPLRPVESWSSAHGDGGRREIHCTYVSGRGVLFENDNRPRRLFVVNVRHDVVHRTWRFGLIGRSGRTVNANRRPDPRQRFPNASTGVRVREIARAKRCPPRTIASGRRRRDTMTM